jgi:hypothetical protein
MVEVLPYPLDFRNLPTLYSTANSLLIRIVMLRYCRRSKNSNTISHRQNHWWWSTRIIRRNHQINGLWKLRISFRMMAERIMWE